MLCTSICWVEVGGSPKVQTLSGQKKKKKDIVWPRRRTPLTHLVEFSPAWHHTMFSFSRFFYILLGSKTQSCSMISITIREIIVSWTFIINPIKWVFPLLTFRHTMFGIIWLYFRHFGWDRFFHNLFFLKSLHFCKSMFDRISWWYIFTLSALGIISEMP